MQQRRLEHDAQCVCSYQAADSSTSHILLASTEGTLQVYVDFVLQWSAKVDTVPIQMAVGQFGDQKGLIVTLDDTGKETKEIF